jgi:hypothetical protein
LDLIINFSPINKKNKDQKISPKSRSITIMPALFSKVIKPRARKIKPNITLTIIF